MTPAHTAMSAPAGQVIYEQFDGTTFQQFDTNSDLIQNRGGCETIGDARGFPTLFRHQCCTVVHSPAKVATGGVVKPIKNK